MLNRHYLLILLLIILLGSALNLQAAPVPEEEETSALTGILNLLSAFSVDFIKNQRYEVETGIVNTGSNDVRVPGEGGDLFSLSDDLKADQAFHFRFRLVQPIAEKHRLIFTYAPLKVKSSGKISNADTGEFFTFHTMEVPAAFLTDLDFDAEYRLDTYKQSYLFDLLTLKKSVLSAGASVQIRDEAIILKGGDYYSKRAETNVAFSGNLKAVQKMNDKVSLQAEADVLIDTQNRAEEIYVGLSYKILKDSKLNAGYRILMRKTDKTEVYNSALFHYLTVGIDLNP